jgi:hypothetical protein
MENHFLTTTGKGILMDETPTCGGKLWLADDFDLARITDPHILFVGDANKRNTQVVKTL